MTKAQAMMDLKPYEPYTLNEGEREILSWAKVGFMPGKLTRYVAEVMEGKKPNPALKLRPITLVDSEYDGPEDKTETISLVPTDPLNICTACISEQYPGPFGPLLLMFFLFSNGDFSRRTVDRMLKERLSRPLYKHINLGGPIRRPSQRDIDEVLERNAKTEAEP